MTKHLKKILRAMGRALVGIGLGSAIFAAAAVVPIGFFWLAETFGGASVVIAAIVLAFSAVTFIEYHNARD